MRNENLVGDTHVAIMRDGNKHTLLVGAYEADLAQAIEQKRKSTDYSAGAIYVFQDVSNDARVPLQSIAKRLDQGESVPDLGQFLEKEYMQGPFSVAVVPSFFGAQTYVGDNPTDLRAFLDREGIKKVMETYHGVSSEFASTARILTQTEGKKAPMYLDMLV